MGDVKASSSMDLRILGLSDFFEEFSSEGLLFSERMGILSMKSSPLAPFRVFTAACKVCWVEDSSAFSALKLYTKSPLFFSLTLIATL